MRTYSTSLQLQVTGLSIGIGATCGNNASIRVYVKASLQKPKLRTLDGVQIQPEDWWLRIGEGEDPAPESAELGAIGWISHSGQLKNDDNFIPESCDATIYLPKAAFQHLITLVSAGAIPKSITLEVAGLRRSGLEPRAIDIWDVKSTESIPIVNFSCEIPLQI